MVAVACVALMIPLPQAALFGLTVVILAIWVPTLCVAMMISEFVRRAWR